MKKSIGLFIVGLIVFILIGVMLFVVTTYIQNDFIRSFQLRENGVTQEKFEINGLNLKPGDKREYELRYACVGGGNYDLTFDFDPKTLGGMENFLVVEVESPDSKISRPLTDLLQDENSIELTISLNARLEESVYLRIIMPVEVGNEAQRTTTSFYVQMTAKHHSEEFGN